MDECVPQVVPMLYIQAFAEHASPVTKKFSVLYSSMLACPLIPCLGVVQPIYLLLHARGLMRPLVFAFFSAAATQFGEFPIL